MWLTINILSEQYIEDAALPKSELKGANMTTVIALPKWEVTWAAAVIAAAAAAAAGKNVVEST